MSGRRIIPFGATVTAAAAAAVTIVWLSSGGGALANGGGGVVAQQRAAADLLFESSNSAPITDDDDDDYTLQHRLQPPVVAAAAAAPAPTLTSNEGCQPIEVSMCKDLPYNLTSVPNFVGNEEQSEAELQLSTFLPLIQLQCSSQLKFFLCSVYVPMCTDKVDIAIGPCRPLCESVRRCCEPMLRQFGFPWPASLNCSKFHPENNAQAMCMRGPSQDQGALCFGDAYPGVPAEELATTGAVQQITTGQSPPAVVHFSDDQPPYYPHRQSPPSSSPSTSCNHLRDAGRLFVRLNKTGQCAQLCQADVLFSIDQKRNAEVLMLVFTAACSLLCFLALAFQLLCKSNVKLRYPDSAVLYICICYAAMTVPYWIRAGGRQALSCSPYGLQTYVISGFGLQQLRCTVVAISLYYFTMASHMWWVILCVCWLLIGSLGFSPQAMQRQSFTFHCVAWILPLIKVIVVFIMQTVDADELTGMCFVGNQSRQGLQFLLVPQTVYLVAGMVPLTLGFVIKLRDCVTGTVTQPLPAASGGARQMGCRNGGGGVLLLLQPQPTNLTCLGLLAAFYAVPHACLLACYAYEYFNRDVWLKYTGKQPSYETFVVKIVSVFVYGIGTGGYLLWKGSCSHSAINRPALPAKPTTTCTPAALAIRSGGGGGSAGQRCSLLSSDHSKYRPVQPAAYFACYDHQNML